MYMHLMHLCTLALKSRDLYTPRRCRPRCLGLATGLIVVYTVYTVLVDNPLIGGTYVHAVDAPLYLSLKK